ncbi:MAG: insulinase family protein [Negativicutes bacterium]|nr:insulinase family protein [Negativicutes bacterium]
MFQKTVLPNGVRVVSETIPYVKSVAIGVWIGTGSRYEQEDNHGVSHFIEHLMFKGTKKRTAKDIAETVDAVGGQLNAFTAKEHTCYYIKVIDTHVDLGMDILSDMLLSSKFDPEDIKREREVVIEEINMYEDAPDELVHDLHLDRVWSGHELGRNILGSKDSIAQLDQRKIYDYYRSHYTADNLVVAGAGNLTHEQLVALSEKYFGYLSGKKLPVKDRPPQLTPARSVIAKDTEQVHLCLGTASVPQNSPELYTAHILNNILGGGISSRLFQSIREERGLAYSVYSYQTNYSDAGLFTVYAGTRPGNTAQVIELITTNIADAKNNGITEAELIKAQEQLKGGLLLGLESSSSRMSRIGKLEITLGKYVTLDEVVAKIERVTLADLNEMANRLFTPQNMCLTVLGPVKAENIPDSFINSL